VGRTGSLGGGRQALLGKANVAASLTVLACWMRRAPDSLFIPWLFVPVFKGPMHIFMHQIGGLPTPSGRHMLLNQ
jgi:hypothetical protein